MQPRGAAGSYNECVLQCICAMTLRVTRLNSIPAGYQSIIKLQETLFEQRKGNLIDDTMLLLQHAPTYTIGKRGRDEDFRSGIDVAIKAGAEVVHVPRGGETTYHGPGQLIAYPIVSLRQLKLGARAYVEALEDIMISTARVYGVSARGRIPGRTGVWVGEKKLGAVGVAISGGVTRHGLAFNVSTDLDAFQRIISCGDPEREATSLARELGIHQAPPLEEAAERLAVEAVERLGYSEIEWIADVNILAQEKTEV